MRRRIAWALGGLAAVLVAVAGVAAVIYARADVDTSGRLDFERPLRIPPVLEPHTDAAGRKVFDLRLQPGAGELLPGKRAATWGINGPHLGPTLRAARGDRVVMRVRNALPEPTTLHWHGMHLPARADGGPHQLVAPGATWTPAWTVDQPAATLWYHPHPHGATADHVYRGLAGVFIVDDAASRGRLPGRYGVDDIPLLIQDKRIGDDGALDFSQHPISPTGRLGDTVLVNGTFAPYLAVRHERVRLRLVNGSTARIYDIGFADDRAFQIVAGDGGLLPRPAPARRVLLSPGERAEIVARFAPGERVVLRGFPPDLGTDPWNRRFSGGDDTLDLLEIRAAARLRPAPAPPDRLGDAPPPPVPAGAATRRFELTSASSIDGRRFDMDRLDAAVAPGGVEVWEVHNAHGIPHSFHVHGVRFHVLASAGRRPPPHLRGPEDTVLVRPGERVRLAVRVPAYDDPHHPFMFHCHLIEHEDRGMMGQFVASHEQAHMP